MKRNIDWIFFARASDHAARTASASPAAARTRTPLKLKTNFSIDAGPMPPWSFARSTVARLSQALRCRDAAEVLGAGRIASTALARAHTDVRAAARAAASMVEAILLAPDAELPAAVRARLEAASRDLAALEGDCADGGLASLAARLDDVWADLARLVAAPVEMRPRVDDAVQDYLARHLDGQVTLGELARALGYSPSHVSTVIRRVTGERFTALRRNIQLDRACFLLRRGTSVKEAALAAGFADPAYFSRVFARRFGMPPSRWATAPR
ncbi:MAG: helix-turn-helix transcriptional regulator [bacterium]|nr:helix-turn-helix transcriptional regulator [bacterium]